ncbi:MAG: PHP domain-containing protein [Gammaproteobacteria bacterium]|nr:MAG: PHP domain-containing protein [Gammaproteobacteria bacterium]
MTYDLHCHSHFSDGVFDPEKLVYEAAREGVNTLALTDHDTVEGIERAISAGYEYGVKVIPGIEISTTWENKTVHIIGLGVSINDNALCNGIAGLRRQRKHRAEKMVTGLQKTGIDITAADVANGVATENLTRTHFARYLVKKGFAKDIRTAFDRYLKKGKSAYVRGSWCALEEAIEWIRNAGGLAVVAHPARYGLTRSKLSHFLAEFKDHGGIGIEVSTGRSTVQEVMYFADICTSYGFMASQGSDFHEPSQYGVRLGGFPALPDKVVPVWEHPDFLVHGRI